MFAVNPRNDASDWIVIAKEETEFKGYHPITPTEAIYLLSATIKQIASDWLILCLKRPYSQSSQ
jgi:hypothetical protein